MKRVLRSLGVGAALLLPVASFSIISSGTAGATTTTKSFQVTFQFTGNTIAVTSTCPTTTIGALVMNWVTPNTPTKPTTWYKNQSMYQITCTTTGTVGNGVPATGTDILLLTPTGLLISVTGTTVNFWSYTATAGTGVSFKLIFGTTTCVVSFPTNILFHKTRTVYKSGSVSTAATVITAHTTHTGICTSLANILHASGSTFSGTATIL